MSYSATKHNRRAFSSSEYRANRLSLQQDLFEYGFEWKHGYVQELDYQDEWNYTQRHLTEGEIAEIISRYTNGVSEQNTEWFNNLIFQKSRGAKYIASQLRTKVLRSRDRIFNCETGEYEDQVFDLNSVLPELLSDWAAVKSVKNFLHEAAKTPSIQQRLIDMELIKKRYEKITIHESDPEYRSWSAYNYKLIETGLRYDAQTLVNLGCRFPGEARRFIDLYDQLRVKGRVWRSCYQTDQHRVAEIVLSEARHLPLWVQKVLMNRDIPISLDRLGDIWTLLPCAKAWKLCPTMPRKIAYRIGQLPLWKRMLARDVWNHVEKLTRDEYQWNSEKKESEIVRYGMPRSEAYNHFWIVFDDCVSQGRDYFLNRVKSKDDISRVISLRFKGLTKTQNITLQVLCQKFTEANPEAKPLDIIAGFKSSTFFELTSDSWSKYEYQHYENYWNIDFKTKDFKNEINSNWRFAGYFAGTLVFGKELGRWIDKQSKLKRGEHDALYWLPIQPVRSLQGLSSFLFKYGDQDISSLETISKNWIHLSSEEKQMSFKKLLDLCRSKKYIGAVNADFAAEAARWSVSQNEYKTFEARWIGSLEVPVPFSTTMKFQWDGVTGRFLPRSDARGLFLGQHTNCCQHPNGVGKHCAWYGQERSNSQFFVWEDHDSNILAQSWVWINDQNGVCFDNVESKGLGNRQYAAQQVLQQAANWISHCYRKVTVGTGSSDLELDLWNDTASLHAPIDYSGYRDSQHQKLLAENLNIQFQSRKHNTVFVRGASQDDLEILTPIAQECFPEGWQFCGSDATDMGFILMNGSIAVGYAAIESHNRYICDIAVLPDHRRHSMVLIRKVLQYCKEHDGSWTCDARESTSYRLMKSLHKRGTIRILNESPTNSMCGESMFKVEFQVL